jgi:hypothetical protein
VEPLVLSLGISVLLAASPSAEDGRSAARVKAASLDVFDEPDLSAYSTGQLKSGTRVVVRRELSGGWVAIDPPPESFSWVDRGTIQEIGDNRARLSTATAVVRSGRAGARIPGTPLLRLRRGALVTLLDLEPITLRQANGRRTWVAIEPPPGELHYVRADGLARPSSRNDAETPDANTEDLPDPTPRVARLAAHRSILLPALSESFSSVGPPIDSRGLAAEDRTGLRTVEERHRAILRQPIDRWQLDSVQAAYQSLLERQSDKTLRAGIQARIAQAQGQQSLGDAARALNDTLAKSRGIDSELAQLQAHKLANPGKPAAPQPYDAEGLMQRSSKEVDGERVYALIGPEGDPIAYLKLPPGLSAAPFLSCKVGARGVVRYDESLRARLIEIQDLDALSAPP